MNKGLVIAIAVIFAVAAVGTLLGIVVLLVWLVLPTPVRGVDHSRVSFDLAPDGQRMVFAAADGDLHELDLATGQVCSLTQTDSWEQSPGYSADQRRIVYASGDRGAGATQIWLRSRDGQTVRKLTASPNVYDEYPSFSPDGSLVVFARAQRHRPYSMRGWTWDDWDVYVVNIDGSGLRRVTSEKHYQLCWPRFTVDGTRIYYTTIADQETHDLTRVNRVVDLNGSAVAGPLQRPTSGGGTGAWASDARQSFDGKCFVFVSDRLQPFRYDVMKSDLSDLSAKSLGIARRVSTYTTNPVLSPDNMRVVFLASDMERIASADIRTLWQVRLDGSSPRQIADAELFTNPRSWKSRAQGNAPR